MKGRTGSATPCRTPQERTGHRVAGPRNASVGVRCGPCLPALRLRGAATDAGPGPRGARDGGLSRALRSALREHFEPDGSVGARPLRGRAQVGKVGRSAPITDRLEIPPSPGAGRGWGRPPAHRDLASKCPPAPTERRGRSPRPIDGRAARGGGRTTSRPAPPRGVVHPSSDARDRCPAEPRRVAEGSPRPEERGRRPRPGPARRRSRRRSDGRPRARAGGRRRARSRRRGGRGAGRRGRACPERDRSRPQSPCRAGSRRGLPR